MREAQLIAARIVGYVLGGRSLDDELSAAWRMHATLAAAQRAQIQDLTYGTLRHLGWIDAVLHVLIDKPPRDDRLRQLLRIAIYQLAHTRAAPYAFVDHAVAACGDLHAMSAKGLVNAVLRNCLRRRAALDAEAQRTD